MDPLSVTAGAIAVLGAIQQAAKCIDRLRAIHQAPLELKLLIEEVVDLSELLEHIQVAQKPPEYGNGRVQPTTEGPRGLDWQISRTSKKLNELDQLLQHHASRVHRRAPDFGWVRGRSKANALRDDLKLLRLNLAASLSATASETVNRVESAIERVNVEQTKATQLLTSLVRGLALAQPSSNSPPFDVSSEDGSLSCTFQYSVQPSKSQILTSAKYQESSQKMTRHPPNTRKLVNIEEVRQPMRIYANKSTAACESWCSCVCHAKTVLRVKQPNVVGSISFSYSGLPWVTASCDQKSCRSRSLLNIAVTAQFPAWFWKRYLSSSFSFTPIRGPEINVRLPRTVDWVSPVWGHGLEGNLRAIQDLFYQGLASPWDVQGLGGSLLHYTTDHGHWDLCKFLLQQGAPIDNEDDFKNSPASLAWGKILSGSLTENEACVVASMFSDTDYLQTRQFTILHKIVLNLIPRTLASELDYSTRDLDAVDSSGRTCLSWASARGDLDSVKTLLHHGAAVNFPDNQGNTPLHHARNSIIAGILLSANASTTVRNQQRHTPLHVVCRTSGSLSLLKRLLAAGIDINATDSAGETALLNATYNNHVDCALYLLRQGADINIANDGGDAPINMALVSNVPAVLRELLSKGALYDRANKWCQTILHQAAEWGNEVTVEILKAHGLAGMEVKRTDLDGKTAIEILDAKGGDDDGDMGFKSKFCELLDMVAGVENKVERVMEAVDILKDGMSTITCFTPLASDEEEDDGYELNEDIEGATVFFDAFEHVDQGVRVVEVTV